MCSNHFCVFATNKRFTVPPVGKTAQNPLVVLIDIPLTTLHLRLLTKGNKATTSGEHRETEDFKKLYPNELR